MAFEGSDVNFHKVNACFSQLSQFCIVLSWSSNGQNFTAIKIMSFYGIRRFGCKLLCRRVKVYACFSRLSQLCTVLSWASNGQNFTAMKIMSFYGIWRFGCKLLCKIVNVTFKQKISIASVIDKRTKIMTFVAIKVQM